MKKVIEAFVISLSVVVGVTYLFCIFGFSLYIAINLEKPLMGILTGAGMFWLFLFVVCLMGGGE